MTIRSYIKKIFVFALMAAIAGIFMTACDEVVYDDSNDCQTAYLVKFRYDMNMEYADAFASQVNSVALYVFDQNGNFVRKFTDRGEALSSGEYVMKLDLDAGTYDFIAWCGLGDMESFTVPELHEGVSTIDDLTCTVNGSSADGNTLVDEDLKALFHGMTRRFTFTDAPTVQTATIRLTKNTNNIRILLQHLSGEPVDADDFTFVIEDCNGAMNYDNSLLGTAPLTYYAWHTDSGVADLEESNSSGAITSVGVAIAELTTSRLIAGNRPVFTIYNKNDEKVLSLPLIDYFLLIKGYYNRNMDDQEYLDRQSNYSMTFFLDENDRWASAYIYINAWRVVLDDVDL